MTCGLMQVFLPQGFHWRLTSVVEDVYWLWPVNDVQHINPAQAILKDISSWTPHVCTSGYQRCSVVKPEQTKVASKMLIWRWLSTLAKSTSY